MKPSILITACVFAFLALVYIGSGGIMAGETEQTMPKEITYCVKYGDIAFDHAKHVEAEKNCNACHHAMKEGETPKKCGECHLADEEKDGAPKRKKAFHDQCKGCHKKLHEEGKIEKKIHLCKSCHVKKEKAETTN
jgi:hypothetical protein